MDHQQDPNILLVLVDQLQVMQQKERTSYKCQADYLFLFYSKSNRRLSKHQNRYRQHDETTPVVTSQDRRVMCEWGYDIVDACQIERKNVCIAIAYFDRFLGTNSLQAMEALRSRRTFQLCFVACLIIALKCRAGMIVDADFVTDVVCQSLYSEEEIFCAEKEILSGLQWRLNGPSPHDFIGYFVKLLPSTALEDNPHIVESLTAMAETRAEAAMVDYSISLQTPSSIACASIVSSMEILDRDEFHPLDRVNFLHAIAMITGLNTNDTTVDLICHRLRDLLPKEERPSESNVSNSSEEFDCASSDSSESSVETFYVDDENNPLSFLSGASPTGVDFNS
mmetsp:Transcript_1828/g.3958  ORF Transcript_1828/g.3958 Transcript_1828/m.3958 type:complete len:338 (+) Transcript_1828:46-1059(+)